MPITPDTRGLILRELTAPKQRGVHYSPESAAELLAKYQEETRRAALMEGAAIAAGARTDSSAQAAVCAAIATALRIAALTNDACAQCTHRRGDHLNHGGICTLPTSATTVCGCRRYAHPAPAAITES